MSLFPVTSEQCQFVAATPLATDAFRNGIRIQAGDNGTRACLAGAVNVGTNGLLFDPNGAVLVQDTTAGLPPGTIYSGGLPIAPSGALCVDSGAAVTYNQGMPYTANGSIKGIVIGTLTDAVAAMMAATPGVAKLWLDPSDIATLQQDSAGTTPVVAAGDPIGRIMDKSGAANHLIQATAASRPLWQTTFAAFDGVDDSWQSTANLDMSSTDALTVVVGARKLSDVAVGAIIELSVAASNGNPGSFAVFAPITAGINNYQFRSVGTLTTQTTLAGYAAPITNVVTGLGSISSPLCTLRVNKNSLNSASSQGTGNYGNYPLFVGRRQSVSIPFTGNVYGVLIFPRLLTPSELDVCEQYMAQKSGITI